MHGKVSREPLTCSNELRPCFHTHWTAEADTHERLFRYGHTLQEVLIPRQHYLRHVAVQLPAAAVPAELVSRSSIPEWDKLNDIGKAGGTLSYTCDFHYIAFCD